MVALAGGTGITTASSETPFSCDSRSAAVHVKLAKGIANAGYSRSNWRHGPKKAQTRAIGDHLRCLERKKDREAVRRHVATKRSAQRLYRAYRRIATMRCHGGPEGWFVPNPGSCSTIACESKFSWTAANPSGAIGVYQLLGHGAPWPADTFAKRLQHHRLASQLSRSAWVC